MKGIYSHTVRQAEFYRSMKQEMENEASQLSVGESQLALGDWRQ